MIEAIAKDTGLSKRAVGEVLDSLFGNVKKALKKGDKVMFVGFGTFSVKKRKARKGRNPRTQQEIRIPARKVPVFKPGSDLKKAIK